MQNKALALCRKIVGREMDTDAERLHVIDEYFYSLLKPKTFWGSTGLEAKYDKGFEITCDMISQTRNRDPKQMITFEYLQTLERIREVQKAEQQQARKRGRR